MNRFVLTLALLSLVAALCHAMPVEAVEAATEVDVDADSESATVTADGSKLKSGLSSGLGVLKDALVSTTDKVVVDAGTVVIVIKDKAVEDINAAENKMEEAGSDISDKTTEVADDLNEAVTDTTEEQEANASAEVGVEAGVDPSESA